VPLVEQELLTPPEHLSVPRFFSEVRVTRNLVLCVIFCRMLFVLLTIVFSVLLRFTDSDYLPLVSSNFSYVGNPSLFIAVVSFEIICLQTLKIARKKQ
jgi:hypothetical protein